MRRFRCCKPITGVFQTSIVIVVSDTILQISVHHLRDICLRGAVLEEKSLE